MKVLGLICARGGSKGIPGKNIKELCGKPLIAWSIETALDCPKIQDVVVSTDSEDIADIAKEYGASVPFLRPDHLAQDSTKQIDAIAHALSFLMEQGKIYDAVVLLQPTCPIRSTEDVWGALEILHDTQSDSVITVTEEDGVTLSSYYDLDEQGRVTPKFPSPKEGTNRQDFAPIYRRCGLLYIFRPNNVLKQKSLYGDTTSAYIVPTERAFDIDTAFDWQLTEYLMREKLEKQGLSNESRRRNRNKTGELEFWRDSRR